MRHGWVTGVYVSEVHGVLRAHFGCCAFWGFGPVCNDMYSPLWCHTEEFACSKNPFCSGCSPPLLFYSLISPIKTTSWHWTPAASCSLFLCSLPCSSFLRWVADWILGGGGWGRLDSDTVHLSLLFTLSPCSQQWVSVYSDVVVEITSRECSSFCFQANG